MPEVYRHVHEVRSEEIDALGRASNVAYLEWLVAAATAHSAAQGWPAEAYLRRGAGWVVRSHAIEYRAPAFPGDRVVVETWVTSLEAASSTRRYEVFREATGELLANGETKWAFIDFATGRPRRIPPEIAEAFPVVERAKESLTRRSALASLAVAVGLLCRGRELPAGESGEPEGLRPIGEAKGIHPGRVVWAHDPGATDWKGPEDGAWWEEAHTSYERVDRMVSEAVRRLAGEATEKAAWDALLRRSNRARGRGDRGYEPGEKIALKVNFVGMIFREGCVDPETCRIYERHRNYMNTSPQVICAVLRQLVEAVGAKEGDIALSDTLAYFAREYTGVIRARFPGVRCVDFAGKFGVEKTERSKVEVHWSSRPKALPDYLSASFAEADYLLNVANLKAHTGAGVTLSAKNHMGSLVRWPAEEGYFDLHPGTFSKRTGIYRPLVDLMGHAHLGGKTVLYLLDGLYSGKHPVDRVPRRWRSEPFGGGWTSSVFASEDPVAIDSVGLDFLRAEWEDFPRAPGVDDYLHEAALAPDPPSGTFYDPDHAEPTRRLGSLGVHEHWRSAAEKKYSRNLGVGPGIELVRCGP
ncbi:MAG: thioesterase family protein [Planctomycetota bacterium]